MTTMIQKTDTNTSSINTFVNDEFGSVRTILIDNEPWLVGKDVASVLGYSEPRSAVSKRVDREDRGVAKMETPSGMQDMTIINESGLYALIFGSKLSTAKKFKRWVTSEVLPTLRKTGSYSLVEKPDSYMIDDRIERASRWIEEEQERVQLRLVAKEQQETIEETKPLVHFANQVQASEDCVSMGDMAKLASNNGFKIGRNNLFAFLRQKKVLMTDNTPYQRYLDWFKVTETVWSNKYEGTDHIAKATLVRPRGQVGICKLLREKMKQVS